MKLILEQGLNNCPDQDLQARFDRLCDEQETIDKTGFGKVYEYLNETLLQGKQHPVLFPYTDNEDLIKQALEDTGHGNDEAFCERFMKDYRLFVEGKAIQAKGLQAIASIIPEFGKQAGGWYFVPITILTPKEAPELGEAITCILERDAQTGTGLFSNVTQIEKEDEALDELLCVEAYNCRHSFTRYLAVLKQYNVAGKDGAFLKKDFTQYLFVLLKQCANIIKDNTDSPQRVKNSLNDVITGLDSFHVWGLFFQMLVLQGLCQMLESIDIKEGDNGFDEAQDLHRWLFLALLDKMMHFCCVYYGENDFKTLTPLCEYLCTTEAGKMVQQRVKREYYPEPQPEAQTPPEPQPEAPEQPQTKARKGRPAKTFASHLIGTDDKDKQQTLHKLHSLIDGRQGKEVVLYIKAAIKCGLITKPTFATASKEFGDIGGESNYYTYLRNEAFTDDEMTGAISSLTQK